MRMHERIYRYLRCLPRSALFCLRYLPLRQAVRLPILISHHTVLQRMDGTVKLEGPIRPGMVRIGFGWLPEFDWRRSHGVWNVLGDVVFEGSALIVYGVRISVGQDATLRFGDDVFVNADTRLTTTVGITIGAGSKISWENVILDDDDHHIDDKPPRAAITLGEHVWTGGRVMILKGVTLADGTIVGANSVVTRSVAGPETLIAGSPVRELRAGLRWHH